MSSSPTDLRPPAAADPAADALVAADRWSLWRTVARGLAHQLGNASQMLALDPPPPLARAEAAAHVATAHARLAESHRDDAPAPTLVPEALADLQTLQRLQAGLPSTELAIDAPAGLPAVQMRAADLRHALLALVTNAKQAVPGERARIRVRALAVSGGVEIAVEDDGPGLPGSLGERVFEPFVTTRAGALGLGLTVARALAGRAGGTLVAGPGASRLVLRLPAWPAR